jgi:hypothetical protein
VPDGSIILMGGGHNDVWRSKDSGTTWSEVTESAPWASRNRFSSVAQPDGSIVLMGGWTGSTFLNDVWWSPDNGASWTQMTANADWSPRGDFCSLLMPDGSILLMGGDNINPLSSNPDTNYNDVWRSVDNGIRWTLVTSNAEWPPRSHFSAGVMPDGSIVLMGGLGNSGSPMNDVWRSTDEGATWKLVTPDAGWPARYGESSVVMPDGSIVIMGGLNGNLFNDVWRSTDDGTTWTELSANAAWSARYGQASVVMPDKNIVLMGGSDIGNIYNDVWQGVLPISKIPDTSVGFQIPVVTSTTDPENTLPASNNSAVSVTTTAVPEIMPASTMAATVDPSATVSETVTPDISTNVTANLVPSETITPGFGIISGVGAITVILVIRKRVR